MKCPKCQTENQEEDKVCRTCGTTFSFVCLKCGDGSLFVKSFRDPCGQIPGVSRDTLNREKTGRMKTFVSIVIPAFNAERTIGPCIESLMALDFAKDRYEIIVVNNGSSDGTGRIIDRYPVTGIREPKKGPAAARNAGIRMAGGKIIAFTDADCVADRNWLKELLVMAAEEEIGCFVGEFAGQPDRRIVARYYSDRALISQRKLLFDAHPGAAGGNIAYRSTVFDAVGMFDESFLKGEDGEMYRRMDRHGRFSTCYNQKAVVYHRHPASVRHLLSRSYGEGTGVSKLRLKHAADFPLRKTSVVHYIKILAATLAGFTLCPLRTIRYRESGMPWRKSFAYPLFDKARSIAFVTGILCGLAGTERRVRSD